jgi:ABC-2 type transport system ATP-binding protein
LSGAAPGSAIRVAGLMKRYGELRAVNGIDLEVRRGEIFGLLGPNGAGKTTTIEILIGLLRADAGDVEVLGQRWTHKSSDRALRERIGVQLQETEFSERLTVEEIVRLFRAIYRNGKDPGEVIALLDLTSKRTARAGTLSGGQQQRLSLACALVCEPELLFLDEPSTGLDPRARAKLWEVILAFRERGGTVILTTHSMEEAARLCDRLAIIDHGKVIASGTPRELVNSLGAHEIIELETEGEPSLAPLEKIAGVRSAARVGARTVVRVDDLSASLPAVLAELEKQQKAPKKLWTHQATLDDVFIQRTGKGLEDA